MTIETITYLRKTFAVEVFQLTEDNFDEAVVVTGGEAKTTDLGERYIYIEVKDARDERQKQAFVGDYILKAGKGYKIYTESGFHRAFERGNSVTRPVTHHVFEHKDEDTPSVDSFGNPIRPGGTGFPHVGGSRGANPGSTHGR